MGSTAEAPHRHPDELASARRRAALVAVVAGLAVVPWFLLIDAAADFRPDSPEPSAAAEEFVEFYVDNLTRIPLSTTLYIGQWVIQLVLLVAVVRAACRRLDVAAFLATALAAAATAIYVGAEGVRLWPVMAAGASAGDVRAAVDPAVAKAAVLSRDGLHAPAAVLLGVAVLVIAWLLARSDLWGRWVMAGLGLVAGAFAVSSVLVGPEGLGPGVVFVLWGPVVAVVLLVGRWRGAAG